MELEESTFLLQIILQSYSHQDSMVLAQKQKYRPMEKESPEINPCIFVYLIFYKGGKNIQWGKDSHFNKWCWENWTVTCKRMKLEHIVTPSVQFSSVTQLCPTLCDPMNHSTPGIPVHHHLPELTQTHIHRVSDAIQPSHSLSSPFPPAPNPSQHHSLFQ